MNTYQRETVEFVPLVVSVDGTPAGGFQTSLTTRSTRPTVWTDAVSLDGQYGLMLTTPEAGLYSVWVKVTDAPETVVLNCGYINVK